MPAYVGTFPKSASGAPTVQAITSLGFRPDALIFWHSDGLVSDTWTASPHAGIGLVARDSACVITQGAVSVAIRDNVTNSVTSSRSASKAISIISMAGSTLAEADITSMDADGFTLNWTTNNAAAYLVGYMAIGSLDNARVVGYLSPSSTGSIAYTAASFLSDIVFNTMSYAWANNTTNVDARLMLGAMTAASQKSIAIQSQDAYTTGRGFHCGQGDEAFHALGNTGASTHGASLMAMTASGFNLNWLATTASTRQIYSLCLTGGSHYLGMFEKSVEAAAASQVVTGTPFLPQAILLFSTGLTEDSDSGSLNARFGIGAYDGTRSAAMAFNDNCGVDPTDANAISSSLNAMYWPSGSTQALDAVAAGSSLNANGFTINLTTNTADAYDTYWYGVLTPTPATVPAALGSASATTLTHSASCAAEVLGMATTNASATAVVGTVAAGACITGMTMACARSFGHWHTFEADYAHTSG